MSDDPDRARRRAVRGVVPWCLLLVWCPRAFALNPALDVSQYAHTAWKIRDGFTKGVIEAIAQTPDGYLWLGTDFGLLRFDGIRNVPWQSPADQHLPSNQITRLLVARDGTLWIGTDKGLASWKSDSLTQYPDLAGREIGGLLEDRTGVVWATGLTLSTGTLCAINPTGVRCYGEQDGLGRGLFGLYEDSKSNLWLGGFEGLWRWKPGASAFFQHTVPNGIQGFAEEDNGRLLVSMRGAVGRLADGKVEAVYPLPAAVQQFEVRRLLRDRDGGLWIGTGAGGLVHMYHRRTDVFAQSDSLSGNIVNALFEDREGNIWVATDSGLDRFHDVAAPTFSVNQGLSNANVMSVLADKDGSVWVGTLDGLTRWHDDAITIYREQAQITRGDASPKARVITGRGLPDPGAQALFQDSAGRVWLTTRRGVGYFRDEQYRSISGVPGGVTHSIAEDTHLNLWFANQHFGLFRVSPAHDRVERIAWATLGGKEYAINLLSDPRNGGVWLGYPQSGVAHVVDGQVRASYTAADGLGHGSVNDLRFDRDGTLWAATDGGLSRLKNGRLTTLTSRNGLPCDVVRWMLEDDAQSFWLSMSCGLVRIARSDLDAWIGAVDRDENAKHAVQATIFDSSDGVRTFPHASYMSPQAARSTDGRLWFVSADGVSVIDLRQIPVNRFPPPVHIEQIAADRKAYDAESDTNRTLRLPALTRDLQIDYTALSLVAPEKMRFRYKLEGWDRDWQDVGTRRQAYYNNLPPRAYRFRVTASNNSGVWNEAGTFVDFSVAPAYYQTTWFRVSVLAALLLLIAVLHQLRLRRAARQFNLTLEARVSERTRIARDLHDTLLQSFHGVLLQFRAATNLLPDHSDARKTFESAIDQAAQAITEGRDAVQGLRASTIVTNDLAPALRTLGDELASNQPVSNRAAFEVEVEGTPRDLHPIMRDEIYRVAGEALRNAFRHAQATRIEVEIRYDDRYLRVRVRDDGKGIDAHLLDGGGRAGHYGLAGMYERAALIGGKLTIWSELGSGTEVELTIPASVAYAKSPRVARSLASGAET